MGQLLMTDAGSTNTQFYQTSMQPAKWYQWFRIGKADDKDDSKAEGKADSKADSKAGKAGDKDDSVRTKVATDFARI